MPHLSISRRLLAWPARAAGAVFVLAVLLLIRPTAENRPSGVAPSFAANDNCATVAAAPEHRERHAIRHSPVAFDGICGVSSKAGGVPFDSPYAETTRHRAVNSPFACDAVRDRASSRPLSVLFCSWQI